MVEIVDSVEMVELSEGRYRFFWDLHHKFFD